MLCLCVCVFVHECVLWGLIWYLNWWVIKSRKEMEEERKEAGNFLHLIPSCVWLDITCSESSSFSTCYYDKHWYHSSFDKLAVCCWRWIDGRVEALQNDLLKFSTKLYSLWTADTAQTLTCWVPSCPYYLPRMPSGRLALICTALFCPF